MERIEFRSGFRSIICMNNKRYVDKKKILQPVLYVDILQVNIFIIQSLLQTEMKNDSIIKTKIQIIGTI